MLFLTSACASDSSDDDKSEDSDEVGMISIEPAESVDQTNLDESALDAGTVGDAATDEHPGDETPVDVAISNGRLTYHGGPTLTHVRVHPVYWNENVRFISHLEGFYRDITRSSLFDMLRQYSGIQLQGGRRLHIGHGLLEGGFIDTKEQTALSDRDIHKELNRLFSIGALPVPTVDDYYPIHLPPHVTIVGPGNTGVSCRDFCGYHGSYKHNGANVYYGIIVDHGCNVCLNSSQVIDRNDSSASHELIEAVTDPAIGDRAWFDPTSGEEIADICLHKIGKLIGKNGTVYTIQKEWSNRDNKCVMR